MTYIYYTGYAVQEILPSIRIYVVRMKTERNDEMWNTRYRQPHRETPLQNGDEGAK